MSGRVLDLRRCKRCQSRVTVMAEHKSADERCVACDKEFPTPPRSRYACCNGTDCGCYGAVIPESFCSLSCYENYDPTPWCSGCGAMKKKDCDCGPAGR